jgi:hypothetical protein
MACVWVLDATNSSKSVCRLSTELGKQTRVIRVS